MDEFKPGDEVVMQIERSGRLMFVAVDLGMKPDRCSCSAPFALSASALSAQSHQTPKAGATGAVRSPAPTAYTVENLTVEGNHNYTAAQILAVAGLRVGQKAGKPEFEAARAKLEATGAFDNVSYRFAPSKDAEGYDVVFEVGEVAQVYPVRFEDLPATDAQLRAWLKQKDPLFGEKIPATKAGSGPLRRVDLRIPGEAELSPSGGR